MFVKSDNKSTIDKLAIDIHNKMLATDNDATPYRSDRWDKAEQDIDGMWYIVWNSIVDLPDDCELCESIRRNTEME